MKSKILVLCLVLFFGGCAMSPKNAEKGIPFSLKKTIKKVVESDYLLYLPPEYSDTRENYPLIFFLHGAGERGNEINVIRKHGPMKYLTQQENSPFIIIAPQCPEDSWWNEDVLVTLLEDVFSKYRVDKDRVYLTGLSMGGFGTWELGTNHPEYFAAMLPICGGGKHWEVDPIKNMPIWVFHGKKDPAVPILYAEKMVTALKKVENKKLKYTVYPEATHDSWTKTYNNPEVYEWFLQNRLSDRKVK